MRLVLLYGPVASGKLTIGRLLSEPTGMKLFHNHLIVDAVAAVFPFGSAEFVRLRETFWLETIAAAARAGQSLVFTFAPEPTVAADFPERLAQTVRAAGGELFTVALTLDDAIQEQRIVAADRAAFGKLRSPDLLRELRAGMRTCMDAMPAPDLRIDTGFTPAADAAETIAAALIEAD
jgi:hypothetical protein